MSQPGSVVGISFFWALIMPNFISQCPFSFLRNVEMPQRHSLQYMNAGRGRSCAHIASDSPTCSLQHQNLPFHHIMKLHYAVIHPVFWLQVYWYTVQYIQYLHCRWMSKSCFSLYMQFKTLSILVINIVHTFWIFFDLSLCSIQDLIQLSTSVSVTFGCYVSAECERCLWQIGLCNFELHMRTTGNMALWAWLESSNHFGSFGCQKQADL